MTKNDEPKVTPDGFWMKTRFYREGPYLSVLSTAVANGEPEIFRARIDLRPFERAVRKYHAAISAEAMGLPQKARDAVNASPAALKPKANETEPKLEVPFVPVEGYVGADEPPSLPADPKAFPGLPGGPPFNWDSLPVVPDGGHPKTGIPAVDKIIPAGTTRYLSTLANPRKKLARIPPDEMALMVATYNQKYGTSLPIDPMSPLWKTPGWWPTREAIARVAVGRWNSWMCQQGKGHCPEPGVFKRIGDAIGKIPIVGDVVHIAAEAVTAPLALAKNIATGERLDHALMGALKDQVKIVKDVAPYAQTVASFVPGIGTGISAAIGAGTALAEGRSIDEAAKAAIRGALPGGQAAASAFDLATKVASGENVGKAALESARNVVPAGAAQKAFDVGVAVATGAKLQDAVAKGLTDIAPANLAKVLAMGQSAVASMPALAAAKELVPSGASAQGFDVAAGLLSHSGMNQKAIEAVRAKLAPAVKSGFDAALRTQEQHYPWLENVTSGASAIGKGAETMGKAALLREVTAFQQGVVSRAAVAAKGALPSVPKFGMPNALSSAPTQALAAYAAANQAWNSIEDGKNAAAAVNKIAQADKLVSRVKTAATKIGPSAVAKSLESSPALKGAVTTALAVKGAAKRVTPAVVSKAVGAQTEATKKIAALTTQMKHATDPKVRQAAATSLEIMKIVADNREKLASIASLGGRPAPHVGANVGCCIGCIGFVGGEPGNIGRRSPSIGCSPGVGCCSIAGHHGGAAHFSNVQMGELPGGYHPHMMTVEGHHGGAGAFSGVQMGELPGGYHPHEMTVEGHHGGAGHWSGVRMGTLRGGYHPHQMTVGASNGSVLTIGSRGAMVAKWQRFLNLFPGTVLKVDGVYGSGTAAATRAFQSSYDLIPDGVVGPATLHKAIQIQASLPHGTAHGGLDTDLHVSGHHGGAGHWSDVRMGAMRGGYHPRQMTSGRLDGGDIESILTSHPFDDLVEGRPRPMAQRHALARQRFQTSDGAASILAAASPEDPTLLALCMDQIRRNRALGAHP